MHRLPRRDQELLALAAWSGLEQSAIGAVPSVPVGTVKSRLSRARERLRRISADPPRTSAQNSPATPAQEQPS